MWSSSYDVKIFLSQGASTLSTKSRKVSIIKLRVLQLRAAGATEPLQEQGKVEGVQFAAISPAGCHWRQPNGQAGRQAGGLGGTAHGLSPRRRSFFYLPHSLRNWCARLKVVAHQQARLPARQNLYSGCRDQLAAVCS
eukprot:6192351-Pleurochrysis_carterae.AAC.4